MACHTHQRPHPPLNKNVGHQFALVHTVRLGLKCTIPKSYTNRNMWEHMWF